MFSNPIDKPEDYPNCEPMPYLTINGHEKYYQINNEDFKVDLKQFIDKKSNKIKFNLSAIKKLLPYDGFYPQDKTKQIASLFNDVFIDSTGIVTDANRVNAQVAAVSKTMALTQPLFAPGILFNTIKAGIAMSWPCVVTGSPDDQISNQHVYVSDSNGNYAIREVNHKFQFESIINPSTTYKAATSQEGESLLYLDPSTVSLSKKYINDEYPSIPTASYEDISKMANAPYKNIYSSCINNFLYETVNFFLKDSKLTSFSSAKYSKDDLIPLIPNTNYCAILNIQKSSNFSMFNRNNYSGSNAIVPSASLFGPPCRLDEEIHYFNDNDLYNLYSPPYFKTDERSKLLLQFNSSNSSSITLQDLFTKVIEQHAGIQNPNSSSLKENINIDILEKVADTHTWYIQTKFETPLINFNKCSTIQVTSSEYPMYIINNP